MTIHDFEALRAATAAEAQAFGEDRWAAEIRDELAARQDRAFRSAAADRLLSQGVARDWALWRAALVAALLSLAIAGGIGWYQVAEHERALAQQARV